MTFTAYNDECHSYHGNSICSGGSEESIKSVLATKVFGDLVADQDQENSLCYSPSPYFSRIKKKGLTNITNTLQESKSTLPFGSITFTPNTNLEKLTEVSVEKTSPKKRATTGKTENTKRISKKPIKVMLSAKTNTHSKKRINVIKRKGGVYKTRPSINPKLSLKAQIAIDLATESVNCGINSSRIAKNDHKRQVQLGASNLREEWLAEKKEAALFFTEAEKTKQNLLHMRRQLYSKVTKTKVEQERESSKKRLEQVQNEILFKSEIHVNHKKKLKEDEEERKRNSICIRANIREEHKNAEEKMRLNSIQEEHESYELKWAGERDTKEYKKKCEEQRRESFAFRNAEGVRQRLEKEENDANDLCDKHDSYELKWAGENDTEEYKKKCEEQRRESFAFRNAEGVRHRAVMEELKILNREKETESFLLKWAGENDMKQYLDNEAQLRRDSFAFRNKEGKFQRELEQAEMSIQIENSHKENELQSACLQDMNEYKKKCAERDRASLCYRWKEAGIQRLEDDLEKQKNLECEQERSALDLDGRKDVEKYLEDCKKRRRQSLACRAKEHRIHNEWKRKKAEDERKERRHRTRLAGIDRKYIELELEKDRARIALNTLRHVGSFSINPFQSILD